MEEFQQQLEKAISNFLKELDSALHFTQFTDWLTNKLNDRLK